MLLVVVFAVVVLLWWFFAARRRSTIPVARQPADASLSQDTGSAARLRGLQADLAAELARRGVRDSGLTDFLAAAVEQAAAAQHRAGVEPVELPPVRGTVAPSAAAVPPPDRPAKAARRYHTQHGAHDPLDPFPSLPALAPLRPRAALRALEPAAALAARKPLPSHQPGGSPWQ